MDEIDHIFSAFRYGIDVVDSGRVDKGMVIIVSAYNDLVRRRDGVTIPLDRDERAKTASIGT